MNIEEELNKAYIEASIKSWEKETGCKHYSNMSWFGKLRYRIKRAYLAFRNII